MLFGRAPAHAPALIVLFALAGGAEAAEVGGCAVFPEDNAWNVPVDTLPVHERSADYVASIGAEDGLKADFGAGLYEGSPVGIPYVVVPADQARVEIRFAEGGAEGTGDRHVIVVQEGDCALYELYKAVPNADGSWNALSAARYDLVENLLRPSGWTSADAAGLPILPGLARAEEVKAGAIRHALRFTAPRTGQAFVWPARHHASQSDDPALPPLGQRFRLKADFDISGFSPENQVILKALQTYGMILADNGSPWFVSGAPDEQWNNDDLAALREVKGSDFEAVDTSSMVSDLDSAAVIAP